MLGYGEKLPDEIFAFDETKLYIDTSACSLSGAQVEAQLQAYKIDVEMVCANGVLAMTGAGDSIESIGAFAEALLAIEQTCRLTARPASPAFHLPSLVCAPEQALEQVYELNNLQDAVGKVSAEYVWAYPPGIPLLIPGERIDASFAEAAKQYAESGIRLRKSRSKENDEIAVIAS